MGQNSDEQWELENMLTLSQVHIVKSRRNRRGGWERPRCEIPLWFQ